MYKAYFQGFITSPGIAGQVSYPAYGDRRDWHAEQKQDRRL
jgi:hypothetical protein